MLPRVLRPELMDDPALATDAHRAALAGLARLNTLSGAGATMARAVREMAVRRGVKDFRTLSLLDVACGGGDVVAGILRVVPLRTCTLWDFSQTALDRAREKCGQSSRIQYVRGDVFNASLPPADIVTCSLFLHHLTSEQAVLAMRAMANAARMGIIVSDLRRCKFGSLLATGIPRLVTTSYVVHTDARLSAAAAWSEEELAVLCTQAGLLGARIERKFPARVLVTWDRAPALRGGA